MSSTERRLVPVPSLYPVMVKHTCSRCGESFGPFTYASFRAQQAWEAFYKDSHWQDGCDGELQTLVPTEDEE